MRLYVDASAVLCWLLREPQGDGVGAVLDQASLIHSSELTLVECDRALLRLQHEDLLHDSIREELTARIAAAAMQWTLLAITPTILLRARLPFAGGPIRSLDAIHLASALEANSAVPGLTVLSLDGRVRKAARALGFPVAPA